MANLSLFWVVLWFFRGATLVIPSHIQECPIVLDIIFMLDSSKSMKTMEFDSTKEMMSNVISNLRPSTEGTHVGILSFAQSSNIIHSLKNIQDKTAIQNALSGVTQWAGEANTLLAFNEAYRQMNLVQSSEQHKRRRVLVFGSNGRYSFPDMGISAAQQVKDDGIVIISLAVSNNASKAPLQSVATSENHVVIANSPRDESTMNALISMICKVDRKPGFIVSFSKSSRLRDHVIVTTHAWDDLSCALSCLHTKSCFSFNFKESSQVCELNHSNRMTSPKDLIMDFKYSYYELEFP